jgi:hypothetical protein
MNIEIGSIKGNVQPYRVEHKLNVDGEGMYLTDLSSSIRKNAKVNISLTK